MCKNTKIVQQLENNEIQAWSGKYNSLEESEKNYKNK